MRTIFFLAELSSSASIDHIYSLHYVIRIISCPGNLAPIGEDNLYLASRTYPELRCLTRLLEQAV